MGMQKLVQAKVIDTLGLLKYVADLNSRSMNCINVDRELSDRSIYHAVSATIPEKVTLAKMRSLIKQKLISGCACGCIGSFGITEKGKTFISEAANA
jgi:hypothetical protein